MVIVKVLKRKDGAALVVGIVTGVLVVNFISQIIMEMTARISVLGTSIPYTGQGWRTAYLQPIVAFVLALIALELLTRIYVALHNSINKKA